MREHGFNSLLVVIALMAIFSNWTEVLMVIMSLTAGALIAWGVFWLDGYMTRKYSKQDKTDSLIEDLVTFTTDMTGDDGLKDHNLDPESWGDIP